MSPEGGLTVTEVAVHNGATRERVVVDVDSAAARWIGALALFSVCCWLLVVLVREDLSHWHTDGQLRWSLSVMATATLISRGIFLGRPVTLAHAAGALSALLAGIGFHVLSLDLLGDVLIVGAGLVLMWPTTAAAEPKALPRVWALVNATTHDPLAPFAMQSLKSYHFSADGRAAIAYRARAGFAVVSGDPIGDPARYRELVSDFATMCHRRGWRMLVLGCSENRLTLWRDAATLGQSLTPIPIGRDVVIEVASFATVGRKYRNLRQAVQRTRNVGISTEVVAEHDLDDALRAELDEIRAAAHRGSHTERGFSMMLDRALEGAYPGIRLIIARDRSGRVQGFHRYASAGEGSEVTLDLPWRRAGAPNGIDERLSVDMLDWCKHHGGQRLSLAFAAFPEIFDDHDRSRIRRVFYRLIHLGDSLIALESLYRYLHKFHSPGQRRYVLLSWQHLGPALFILLSLEFMPHRHRRQSPFPHASASKTHTPHNGAKSVGRGR
jgi:lysylphosphatidylglycerol synthetase-like protein (DUF2156 family)